MLDKQKRDKSNESASNLLFSTNELFCRKRTERLQSNPLQIMQRAAVSFTNANVAFTHGTLTCFSYLTKAVTTPETRCTGALILKAIPIKLYIVIFLYSKSGIVFFTPDIRLY